jgi:hypothetical protein
MDLGNFYILQVLITIDQSVMVYLQSCPDMKNSLDVNKECTDIAPFLPFQGL